MDKSQKRAYTEDRETVLETDKAVRGAEGAVRPSLFRTNPYDRDVWAVLGLPIDRATIDTAVGEIDRAVASGSRLSFVTPNVNWLVRATSCETARSEIADADLSLADGAPLAAMAKLLGVPLQGRVAGSDLFEALRRRPAFSGRRVSVFFFGGRDGSAEAASKALESEESGLRAAGWLNPGFGSVEDMSRDEIIDEINAAAPDFIVVALGAAKGQAWIQRNKDRLNAPAIAHLGAVVDFTSGGIARAPEIMQKAGLEWAWRIKEEPSLWKRYAMDAVGLAKLVAGRLAPLLAAARLQKSRGAPSADIKRETGFTSVRLEGDHLRADLSAVRSAFLAAQQSGADVVLEIDALGRVDMAFMGLVLLLEQNLKNAGRKLYVTGCRGMHNVIFSANGFKVNEAVAAGEEVMIEEAVSAAG